MALVDLFLQNVPAEAPHVLAVKTSSGGFRPQDHYQDISYLLTFYLELKFDLRFFRGPLVYLFRQNIPPEATDVPAVETCSGGFRPQVWHYYQDISLL